MLIKVPAVALAIVITTSSSQLIAQQEQPDLLDAEQAFQIAKAASAAGDFQSAIIALERILVISPNLANIQFELGLLYKRVGAPRRAEYFFRESLKSDAMPADIRKRAETEVAELSTERPVGTFGANVGFRLQQETNPGSFTDEADFFDTASQSYVTGTSIGSEESDGASVFSFGGSYKRQFGKAARHQWRTSAQFSTTNYFSESEFNESTFTLNADSSLALASSSPSHNDRASPYVYYRLGLDGSEVEDATVGAGVRFSKSSKNWSTTATIETNSKTYKDDAIAETSDQTGGRASVGFKFRMTEASKTTFGVSVNLSKLNSVTDSQSYSGTGLSLSASYPISAFAKAPRSSLTVTAGLGDRNYEAVNLVVSDTRKREDDLPNFGVSLNFPFSNGFGVNAGVRVQDNRSNLPNYRYQNTTSHVGINWRY